MAGKITTRKKNTKNRALKVGRDLLQLHGYNGFSFQDIADQLTIKKQSLYDHFASKEDLIIAIIENYNDSFEDWTKVISQENCIQRIQKIFEVFYSFASDHHKICPVLALTSDTDVPSKKIKKAIKNFVEKWLVWLTEQVIEGQKNGSIRKDIDPNTLSAFIYSQGMGSQLQSRLKNDPKLPLISGDIIIKLIRS